MLNKLSKFDYSPIGLTISVIVAIIILLALVLNSTNIIAKTNRNNFLYTIEVRDSVEYIDIIFERAEVNLKMYSKAIYGPYDLSKINDERYNEENVNQLNPLTKLVLSNSPGTTGAWFQYKTGMPFGDKIYSWYEFKNKKFIDLKETFKEQGLDDRALNIKDDPYYFKAIAAKKPIWSDIYADVDTKELLITFAEPVYKNGNLIGVAGIDITVSDLLNILKMMQDNFQRSEIFLLDSNKNVIISQVQPEDKNDETGDFFNKLFFGISGDKMAEYNDNGLKRTAILLKLSNGYFIVITFPNNIIYKGLDNLILLNYFIFFLLFVLLFIAVRSKRRVIDANKILESEINKIKNIINYAPTMMCIKDRNGRYLVCNDKFADMVGLEKEKIIGKTAYDILSKEEADIQVKKDKEVTSTKQFTIYEQWVINVKGEKRRLEKYKIPLLNSKGEVDGIFMHFIDITKRYQEREHLEMARDFAEKAAQMKSNFLANMSHEIRTPLNGVVGFLQLLEDTNLDDGQREFVFDAKKSSELLLDVINEILDFSKIEAGKLQIDNISFNVRSIVEDVTVINTTNACQKNLDINSLICSDIPQRVYGDPGRLKQILNNLVSNAIKFTHEGDIIIYVNKVADDSDTVVLSFKVKDTGIGITEDKLKMIFDSFNQADISTTRKYGGTGLGLSISQKLAEMMNGHISVESEPGKGSTFTLTMSFVKANAKHNDDISLSKSLDGMNILLVNNNKNDSKIIRYYLNEANCSIKEVKSVDEALGIVDRQNSQISAVLIDYISCKNLNLELNQLIKTHTSLEHIPLILYTSLARKGDAIKAKKNGFKGFLTKPFKKQELIDTIAISVSNHLASNQLLTKHFVKEKKFDSKTKILIVEDMGLNCKFILKLLSKMGVICDIAADGKEAVEAFRTQNYDLIIMDCQMPILDGYEATKEIRNIENNKSHIPIVAMTANAMHSDVEKCLDAGMDDYISKPVDKEKLFSVLSKYLKFEIQSVEISEETLKTNNDSYFSQIIEKLILEIGFTREETIQIINEFLEFLVQSVLEFDAALDEGDYDFIKSLAHKLKGSSANLKIDQITSLSIKLEKEALQNDKDACRSVIDEIKEYLKFLNQEVWICN